MTAQATATPAPGAEHEAPAPGMSCQVCGTTLLWAADLCGLCAEEREAVSTTTTEGEDG